MPPWIPAAHGGLGNLWQGRSFWNNFSEFYPAEVCMKTLLRLVLAIGLFTGAVRMGFSRGDKIIPQVVDGPGWMTKFDLTNVSTQARIQNMKLSFYKNDGSHWTLQ